MEEVNFLNNSYALIPELSKSATRILSTFKESYIKISFKLDTGYDRW